jgi:apyrase
MAQVVDMTVYNVVLILLLLLLVAFSYPSTVHGEASSVLGRKAGIVDDPAVAANAPAGLRRWPYRYAVIFDAGSTGSRVHVFKFHMSSLKLLPFSHGEIQIFDSVRLHATDAFTAYVYSRLLCHVQYRTFYLIVFTIMTVGAGEARVELVRWTTQGCCKLLAASSSEGH